MITKMTLLLLFHFLLFVLFENSTANTIARFEFESVVGGPGAQRSPWRSNASSSASLHMFKGDIIHLDLCLSGETRVQLKQFMYSNDGISDQIKVHLDNGQIVDTIKTEATIGGWGQYWDIFKSYKGDGQTFRIDRGKQTLIIEVVSADCFGTEFDAIEIQTDVAVSNDTFFCGGKLIRSPNPSRCAVIIDATTLPPTPIKSSSIRQTISTASTILTSPPGEMHFRKTTSALRSLSPSKGMIHPTTKASLTNSRQQRKTTGPVSKSQRQTPEQSTTIQAMPIVTQIASTHGRKQPKSTSPSSTSSRMTSGHNAEEPSMPTTTQVTPTTVSSQTNVATNLTDQKSTKITTPKSTQQTNIKQSTGQTSREAMSNTISTASTILTSPPGKMHFRKTTSALRSLSPSKGMIHPTTIASLTDGRQHIKTTDPVSTSPKSSGETLINVHMSSPPAQHTTSVKSTTLPMSNTITMTTASTPKQPTDTEIDDKPGNMKTVSTSSPASHTNSVKSTTLTMSKPITMPTAITPKPPTGTEIDVKPGNMKTVSTSVPASHTTSGKSTILTMSKTTTIQTPKPPTDTEIEDKPGNTKTDSKSSPAPHTTSVKSTTLPISKTTTIITASTPAPQTTAAKPSTLSTIKKATITKKQSTTKMPFVTKTTTATATASTVPEKAEKPLFLVKQLSFPNACLSTRNIRLRYTPLSLKGMTIIARANAMRNAQFTKRLNAKKNIDVCRNRIWQIGRFNDDHADLGPIRYYNIDYDVNAGREAQMPFPGLINPKFTRTVTMRYVVPGNIYIGKGTVYLTLGMVNISADVAIGVQYHIRRKKNPSDIEYVTLTPEQNVVGWDIPARAISPSLENVITLYFNMLTPTPLKVDFLRLESLGEKHRSKKQIIARVKKWRVRAFIYKQRRNKPQIKGLTVSVDGGNKESNLEKVVLFHKPNKKSLTIYKDGRIIPFHHTKPTEETTNGSMLSDTSGILFGNPNTEIETVDLYTKRHMVYANIVYSDRSFVHLSVNYTDFRTKIKVLESSVTPPAVEFFSTYITDYVAAVNEIVINNNKRFDIIDKNIDNTKGQRYTFLKTTPNKMYNVNDEYEFVFPRQVIPK